MKSTLKRFLSLVLCMCMVMALLPNVTMTAFAATSGTVTGLADENIGLSFTGDADDAWSANGTSIIGAATSTGGTCGNTSYESTLTITNKKSTTATLSFDYTIEQNSGKIQVDGAEVSSGASFTKELAANEAVKVYIESGSTSAATKITLTNVVLVSDVNATATFVPAENGTYTVDGKLITEEYSNTQSSMTAYQVVATPADGYQFMGWYDVSNEKYISTSAKAALNIENDCTITARFASKTAALFETGGQRFADLNEAVAYAQTNGQSKITLATNGSISGTYTIPTGITLLIPFDEAGTLYTDAPAAIRTTPKSKPFRTLTMSEGTSITVNGAISLGGRYFAAGGGQQGRPVGDYGYIKMADNSSITVKNGGKLYAWGFISGSGSVLAESGATVYEFYQIADFRGGSASSNMGNKVFPFSQYFVQNIEVPLTLNAGANEIVFSGVFAMKTTYTTAINFIGDTGMFKVESGSFTKDYDEKTDRLVFTVNGEAALNTLSLTLAGMDVNSASYVLPITNNITINIQSGNVTINQDAALLAGVEVNIAEGAGLTVANGKNIYFYDSDEWNSDNFVWGPCKFKSVAYAPGKAYNRSNNDLVDAKMDVNGSVTAIGAIYTTKGGADICSSNGTGKYIQQGTPGTETETYQYNADSNAVTIPITAAKLHNSDGSYTETATANAGDVINYVNGVWGGTPCAHENTELRNAKEATCTEPGYTGDTYGKDCWLHKTNGLALPEWGYYFDENGVILHDEDTGKNGILMAGEDLFYYVDGIKAPAGMIKIGDDYYYANSKGQLIVNQTYYCSRMNGLMEEGTYAFDAKGKLIPGATDKNGIVKDDDGMLRYYVNGKVTYVGLIEIDGDFYYVRSSGEVVNDCVYYISWTHGLKEAGYYTFDENGKLTGTPKNGIVEEDGVLHYYVNGTLTYAGLIKIGDDYYYVNSKCEVVRDCDYYISWTHDLMPQGRYHFDADGKLTGSVAPLKNGIYEEDGSLYFYRNGERAYAGLIQIDGYYYYVRSTCEVVHDRSYYVYWTHGLMPEGYYNFDSAGRMILDSETE